MIGSKDIIPFFTDNDVDDALGEFIRDSGHELVRLRDIMLTDSADPVVARACREAGWVLITHNCRHFRAIAQKNEHATGQLETLSRIEMECHQIKSVDRMQVALPRIEFEWSLLKEPKNGLRVVVADRNIKICK